MNAADQVALAIVLRAALREAGWELAQHRQREGQAYYPEADYISAVGFLYRHGLVMRRLEAANAVRPRLIKTEDDAA